MRSQPAEPLPVLLWGWPEQIAQIGQDARRNADLSVSGHIGTVSFGLARTQAELRIVPPFQLRPGFGPAQLSSAHVLVLVLVLVWVWGWQPSLGTAPGRAQEAKCGVWIGWEGEDSLGGLDARAGRLRLSCSLGVFTHH